MRDDRSTIFNSDITEKMRFLAVQQCFMYVFNDREGIDYPKNHIGAKIEWGVKIMGNCMSQSVSQMHADLVLMRLPLANDSSA